VTSCAWCDNQSSIVGRLDRLYSEKENKYHKICQYCRKVYKIKRGKLYDEKLGELLKDGQGMLPTL